MRDYNYFVALSDEALGKWINVHFHAAEARIKKIWDQGYLHFFVSLLEQGMTRLLNGCLELQQGSTKSCQWNQQLCAEGVYFEHRRYDDTIY